MSATAFHRRGGPPSLSLLMVFAAVVAVLGASPASAASWDPVGVLTLVEASGDVAAGTAWAATAASTLPVCAAASRSPAHVLSGARATTGRSRAGDSTPAPVLVLVGAPDAQDLTPFAVMVGPTPHVVASGVINASASAGVSASPVPWAAAAATDVDGDGVSELVLLRARSGSPGGDVVVVKLDAATPTPGAGVCGGTVGVWKRVALPAAATELVGLAVLPPKSTPTAGTTLLVAMGVEASGTTSPLALVSFPPAAAVSTTPPAVNVTRLCLPSSSSGTVTGVAVGALGETSPAGESRVSAVTSTAGADVAAYATAANVVVVTSTDVVAMSVSSVAHSTTGLVMSCSVAATAALPFTQASAAGSTAAVKEATTAASRREAPSDRAAPTTAALVSATVTCLAGDGLGVLVLLTDAPSGNNMYWLADNGTATLQVQVRERIDADGQSLAAAVAVPWLTNVALLPTEHQLLVLRAKPTTSYVFPVRVLVFGRPVWYLKRAAGFSGSLAQYGFDDSMHVTYPLNASVVTDGLTATHANTYSYIVCDSGTVLLSTRGGASGTSGAPFPSPDSGTLEDYAQMLTALNATASLAVNGRQVRFWITLLPPTEAISGRCAVPPDDPRTPFNETSFFNTTLGYLDYVGWSALMGQLSALYPHLVALQIDDMSHDIEPPSGIFTPSIVAQMTSAMRRVSPWMSLISTMYYNQGGEGPEHFVWNLWPDFPRVVDTVLFYFRNQKQGAGPCLPLPCPWGPRMTERAGGCLAGSCADSTVQNAPGEIHDIAAGMPPGRLPQVGFYATGHSSLGTPSPRYVLQLLELVLGQGQVGGVTFYRMHVPQGPCSGTAITNDEGCIVAEVFKAASLK